MTRAIPVTFIPSPDPPESFAASNAGDEVGDIPSLLHVPTPPESFVAEDAKEENEMVAPAAESTAELRVAHGNLSDSPFRSKGKRRAASGPETDDLKPLKCVFRKPQGVVGLKNLGNTCYNNAVIQALSHTTPLREYFLDRKEALKEDKGEPGKLISPFNEVIEVQQAPTICGPRRTRRTARLEETATSSEDVNLCDEFSKLLRSMWEKSDDDVPRDMNFTKKRRNCPRLSSVVSPHSFAKAVSTVLPLFQERFEQQDAQEFLRCALERMQEELIAETILSNNSNPSLHEDLIRETEDTIVKRVFGGTLLNKISCLACKEYTIKPDPFLDLSLVIPDPLPTVTVNATTIIEKRGVTLEDCIDLFSSAENLEVVITRPSTEPRTSSSSTTTTTTSTSNGGRSCLSCGSDSGFQKAFKLGSLPQILCIHLKRFRWRGYTGRGAAKQKVDTPVRFPLQGLDMAMWLGHREHYDSGDAIYDLYAVVVHQGSGVNSGHYTAFVKREDDWWCLNDERASKVHPEVVLKAKAYLLFYQKS